MACTMCNLINTSFVSLSTARSNSEALDTRDTTFDRNRSFAVGSLDETQTPKMP